MSVMRAPVSPDRQSDRYAVLRKYYEENDIFLSAEGILKAVSILGCIASSVLFLVGSSCSGAPGLVTSAATVALVVAAALALLYAGVALELPLVLPQPWFYTDIIISSVAGVLLLVTGVLSMTICVMSGLIDYLHGPLAMMIAAMITGSAAITYAAAMRQWDAAGAAPASEPRGAPQEHDV